MPDKVMNNFDKKYFCNVIELSSDFVPFLELAKIFRKTYIKIFFFYQNPL